jgi:hypothetical protein
MKRPKTIRSEQPCPVCGGHEWHPLTIHREGYLIDDPNPEACMPPLIDREGDTFHDECAGCGTVIV